MEFNKKIKAFLESKGATAGEVGKKIGYSDSMMSRYVNAEKPNIEFIDRLVKLYPDADLNWLLKEDDSLKKVKESKTAYEKRSVELINKIDALVTELKDVIGKTQDE